MLIHPIGVGLSSRFWDRFIQHWRTLEPDAADDEWLETLQTGARAMETRWAVFSFLAGFWRSNWEPQFTGLTVPGQVVFDQSATGIGCSRSWDDASERLDTDRRKLPNAAIATLDGLHASLASGYQLLIGLVHAAKSMHRSTHIRMMALHQATEGLLDLLLGCTHP